MEDAQVAQQTAQPSTDAPLTTTQPYNVYRFQQQAMPVLAGWAAGSIVMGAVWWLQGRTAWVKGFGSQFAGWGAINLIIAIAGLRGAAANAEKYAAGEIEQEQHDKFARTFEGILWVNAVLDVLYMVGGWRFADTADPDDDQRRGVGWGIIAQGAGLLVWDVILALVAFNRRRNG